MASKVCNSAGGLSYAHTLRPYVDPRSAERIPFGSFRGVQRKHTQAAEMGHKQQRNRLRASSHFRVRMQPEQLSGPVRQVDVRHVRGGSCRALRSMPVWTQGLERTTLGLNEHCLRIRVTSSQGGCTGVCRRSHECFENHCPRFMQRNRWRMPSVPSSTGDCAPENGFPRQDDGRLRTRVFGQGGHVN